jgi:hypothetical protein
MLFNMCPQNCNWQISSLRHKLENNIGFTCSNSMFQLLHFHLEFEGGVKFIKAGPSILRAHMTHEVSI